MQNAILQKTLMQTLRNSRAFTIVELLVVVVVIAILASIVIVSYNGVQKSAMTATLQSDLRSAATAIAVEINRSNLSSVTSFPDTVKPSSKVGLSLAVPASGSAYCINGAYANSSSIRFYFDSTAGMKQGSCPGAHIAGTVIGDPAADPSGTGENPGDPPEEPETPQPTIIISDNFDRSNSTSSLGSTQTGQTWPPINALYTNMPQGQWGISGNKAYAVTGNDGDFTVLDATVTNSEVSIRITGANANHFPGLIARGETDGDFYLIEIAPGSGQMWIYSNAQDALAQAPNGTFNNGDLVTLRTETLSNSTRLTALVNNTQVMQVTDSAPNRPVGTFYGFRYGTYASNTNTMRFDDFTLKSI